MTASVSVVIPTFNRLSTVCRAIDSVLHQTRAAAEVIVVDDGSTDGTAEQLQAKYANSVSLYVQPNAGVSAARNTGISKTQGDWIALLDSDDEWLPDKLKQQLDVIDNNTDCVLCHTDEIWIRNGVRVNQMNKHKKTGGDIFENCLPMCAISPSSVLIKKQLLDRVGLFDESLPACEDYDLWLRICAIHQVHYLDHPLLIKYGGHEDQLSRKYWGMDRFRIQALKKLLDDNSLNSNKRQKTLSMLGKKIHILLKGAVKHSNISLIDECHATLNRYDIPQPEEAMSSSVGTNTQSPKPEIPLC